MNSLKVFFASDIEHLSYLPENLHEAGKIDFFDPNKKKPSR